MKIKSHKLFIGQMLQWKLQTNGKIDTHRRGSANYKANNVATDANHSHTSRVDK